MWRPIEWSSKCSKILYSLLTCLTIYLLTTLTLTQLLDIILVIDNVDDFATNSLMLLSAVSVLFKATAVVTHRDEIINLIETLQKKPCKAYNEEESDIQMKFDRLIRWVCLTVDATIDDVTILLAYKLINNTCGHSFK